MLDVPIFHKIYDLYKLIHSYHGRIPKAERYTLWQQCEQTTLSILKTLMDTSNCFGEERARYLYKLSSRLDLLKALIRLAKEIHCLNDKQHLAIQTLLQEIGRMAGGWIKSINAATPAKNRAP